MAMEPLDSKFFDRMLNMLYESKMRKLDYANKIDKSLENSALSWIKFKEINIYYKSLSLIDKKLLCDNYEKETISAIIDQLKNYGMDGEMGFGGGKDDILIRELKAKLNLTL